MPEEIVEREFPKEQPQLQLRLPASDPTSEPAATDMKLQDGMKSECRHTYL